MQLDSSAQRVIKLAAHWNPVGNFGNQWCLHSTSHLVSLVWGSAWVLWLFKAPQVVLTSFCLMAPNLCSGPKLPCHARRH